MDADVKTSKRIDTRRVLARTKTTTIKKLVEVMNFHVYGYFVMHPPLDCLHATMCSGWVWPLSRLFGCRAALPPSLWGFFAFFVPPLPGSCLCAPSLARAFFWFPPRAHRALTLFGGVPLFLCFLPFRLPLCTSFVSGFRVAPALGALGLCAFRWFAPFL